MAITAKKLASGLCPGAAAVVYTAPASTKALVKSVKIHNDNATAETVYLYANDGTADRVIFRGVLLSEETLIFDELVVLEAGQTLKLASTTATGVPYWISGAEVT